MLVAENLSYVYHFGKDIQVEAIKKVSLTIPDQTFASIIGRSGSGKSTLLHILSGLLVPTSGSVSLDGDSLYAISDSELARLRNKNIGFVFQDYFLEPSFSILDNVMLPMLITKTSMKAAREKAYSLLELVGIAERAKHNPQQISGGECQRVCIARALINDPKYVFADEPTGNLDSKNGEMIFNQLQMLKSLGKTIVMVTHNGEAARQISDMLIEINDGELVRITNKK